MAAWRRFPLHIDAPVCDALRTGEAVYLETLDDWERYPQMRSAITGAFEAMVVVPIAFGGACSPLLVLCNRTARRFMVSDRAFLAALAVQAANALERARLYEERAYVARTPRRAAAGPAGGDPRPRGRGPSTRSPTAARSAATSTTASRCRRTAGCWRSATWPARARRPQS